MEAYSGNVQMFRGHAKCLQMHIKYQMTAHHFLILSYFFIFLFIAHQCSVLLDKVKRHILHLFYVPLVSLTHNLHTDLYQNLPQALGF